MAKSEYCEFYGVAIEESSGAYVAVIGTYYNSTSIYMMIHNMTDGKMLKISRMFSNSLESNFITQSPISTYFYKNAADDILRLLYDFD